MILWTTVNSFTPIYFQLVICQINDLHITARIYWQVEAAILEIILMIEKRVEMIQSVTKIILPGWKWKHQSKCGTNRNFGNKRWPKVKFTHFLRQLENLSGFKLKGSSVPQLFVLIQNKSKIYGYSFLRCFTMVSIDSRNQSKTFVISNQINHSIYLYYHLNYLQYYNLLRRL